MKVGLSTLCLESAGANPSSIFLHLLCQLDDFSNFRYYIYDTNFYLRKGPSPVTDFGLPADAKVDAAIQWTGNSRTRWEHGTKTYIFSGTQYYRYNELTGKKDP